MKARLLILIGVAVVALSVVAAASAFRLDVIRGTNGPDVLKGTPGHDVIYGRGGGDVIRAGKGSDIVYGGAGNDVIWVGSGADVAFGGPGNDVLHALANDNQRDVLDCGPGFDKAYVIAHDPVTLRGCEVVIRLSPGAAAAMAAANGDDQ